MPQTLSAPFQTLSALLGLCWLGIGFGLKMPAVINNTLNVLTLGIAIFLNLGLILGVLLLVRKSYVDMLRTRMQDAEAGMEAMRKRILDMEHLEQQRREADRVREARALRNEHEIKRLKKRSEFDREENERLEALLALTLEIIEPLANGSKARLQQRREELMRFRAEKRQEIRQWEEEQETVRSFLDGPTDGG
jgi:hypothetical protein